MNQAISLTREIAAIFLCGASTLFAATMPTIQGTVFDASGRRVADARVELFADNGDLVFSESDELVDTVATDELGNFDVGDLEPTQSYFVSHDGQISALQSPGAPGYVIDSFDVSQSIVANPIVGYRTGSIAESRGALSGGHRDMYLQINGGDSEGKFRVNPFALSSHLQIDMSAGVTGMAAITWDGTPGTTGMDPDHGLDMDFTDGGRFDGIMLSLAVDEAGSGQMLKLVMHSEDGTMSEADVQFPVVSEVEPTTLVYVPFREFQGSAHADQVSAFQLIIDAQAPSLDAKVDMIGLIGPTTVDFRVIPEPDSLVIFGFVFGLLVLSKRASRR